MKTKRRGKTRKKGRTKRPDEEGFSSPNPRPMPTPQPALNSELNLRSLSAAAAPLGLDLVAALMNVGEVAEVKVASKYGFDSYGRYDPCPPRPPALYSNPDPSAFPQPCPRPFPRPRPRPRPQPCPKPPTLP